jgi:hypothetical protein
MPGGLLNIVSYGAANIMLNGNPNKTFFTAVYKKYTNFGLQRFRIDFEGQRNLSFDSNTIMKFKIPRYAELLWDTYIVMNLPDIWSPLYPRPDLTDVSGIPYEFQWIENLGFNMIQEISILSGGATLSQYSGEWMQNAISRDEGPKIDLINRMTGNVPELNNPENAFNRINVYPTAIYDGSCVNIEPSIRGRQLYIPLMAWFCYASKLALPLVAMQYQEVYINIEFKSIRELYTIRAVDLPETALTITCPPIPAMPVTGLAPRRAPNAASVTDQLWRFIQPPPRPEAGAKPDYIASWRAYQNKRNEWNTDIHLIGTYVFLSNDERRQFAARPHSYLVKEQHQYDFLNSTGSQRVKIPSSNMVSSYMFRFRRSDVNLRNQWSNYSNWAYQDTLPQGLFLFDGTHVVALTDPRGCWPGNPMGFNFTGCRTAENIKDILINLGILMGGDYRENVTPAGLYNYIEKYKRTSGRAKDGLYFYNFCIHSDRNIYQPSGAQNTNKFEYVWFEFNTIQPPRLNCLNGAQNVEVLCDPSGAIIGVRKNTWALNEYNFDLRIFEERYNVIKIMGGRAGLAFAR